MAYIITVESAVTWVRGIEKASYRVGAIMRRYLIIVGVNRTENIPTVKGRGATVIRPAKNCGVITLYDCFSTPRPPEFFSGGFVFMTGLGIYMCVISPLSP